MSRLQQDVMTIVKDIDIKEEPDEATSLKYTITSYGTDFDVDGLVKRIIRGDIFVPSFQRGYVWTVKQASRFIESLLLGLPVPGIFLSRERETQKLLVIDGQQRLNSLRFFYEGVFSNTGREFVLTGLQSRFNGVRYRTLPPESKRQLDDSIIHATIVRQDEPDDGSSSVYFIFERLNSGGVQLQPQEIRSALYHGDFNEAIAQLNSLESWRALYGPVSPRKRDEELILRFLALYFYGDKYEKPMKEFLNAYMGKNRNLGIQSADKLRDVFQPSVDIINQAIGPRAFKPKRTLNAAVFDSLMVGLARRLEKNSLEDLVSLRSAYESIVNNTEYISLTETSTSDEENVRRRLEMATVAFDNVA